MREVRTAGGLCFFVFQKIVRKRSILHLLHVQLQRRLRVRTPSGKPMLLLLRLLQVRCETQGVEKLQEESAGRVVGPQDT